MVGCCKAPPSVEGVKGATKDEQKLKQFFSGPYEIANIAVAAGEPSGMWVLDVDDLGIKALEDEHGPLPRTPTGETGSGGRHYFFRFAEVCADFRTQQNSAGRWTFAPPVDMFCCRPAFTLRETHIGG